MPRRGPARIARPAVSTPSRSTSVPAQASAPAQAPASPSVPSSASSGPAPGSPKRAGLLLVLLLGGMTALPPLSMDMYLPALPDAASDLHASAAGIQLTLTTCLVGLALGQLVVGPLSDRWGRRRPLLAGMVAWVAATLACALAPTAAALTAFRLVQGLAGAAGVVIARAVVRDLYDGLAMARFFSTLMLVSGAAPIVAPLVGGQVLRLTDWRGVFLVLTAVGTLLTTVMARWVPETLPPERRHGGGFTATLRTLRGLLADRRFTGYVLAGSFGFAALFAYVAASSFVVQELYGASAQTYSLLFGLNSIGMVGVGQLNGRVLVGRMRLDLVLATGICVVAVAALALLLLATGVFGDVGLVPVAVALFVLMAAMALVGPNANTLALMRAPHAAGSASALLGTSFFLVGAVASPLVGVAGEHTAVPMAVVQLTCALLSGAVLLVLCRPYRRA